MNYTARYNHIGWMSIVVIANVQRMHRKILHVTACVLLYFLIGTTLQMFCGALLRQLAGTCVDAKQVMGAEMKYKLLGASGLRVSELCLGTMTFGTEVDFGADWKECQKIFGTYVDAGGNFIDTANQYTKGTSERFVGNLVKTNRDRFVVATKYSLNTRAGDPNAGGMHRKNLHQSVEASLKRLDTGYIDLLWLHTWDFTTPADQVMHALDDLVSTGKVLHIGISDTPAWVVAQANSIAQLRGWTPFVALQVEYSLIRRSVERELLPMAKAFDLPVTPWAVLGGGMLTGKYTRDDGTQQDTRRERSNQVRATDRNLGIARVVDAIADELGVKSAYVALSWVRQRGDNIIPIIGARKASQVCDMLESLSICLSEQQMKALNEASEIKLGFPHDFTGQPDILEGLYGDLVDRFAFDIGDHHSVGAKPPIYGD